MYDWLTDALQNSSQVVTANQRLARVLKDEYAARQVAAGRAAWRSPDIQSWRDWLKGLVATTELSQSLPVRLNAHQSRVLWENCLRREINNPLLNLTALVRQAQDTWGRLHDYRVPLDVMASAAQGRDQGVFARAAREYAHRLADNDWIDEAKLPELVLKLISSEHIVAPERITFAGFDRTIPALAALQATLRDRGTECSGVSLRPDAKKGAVCSYEHADAELRAAGAWARRLLLDNPDQSVAIVASQLEKDAERSVRLVREGLVPGWQSAEDGREAAVNVSYGRRMSAYPAIATALQLLRWVHEDIGSQALSILLRSSVFGEGGLEGRSRLDLELRRLPAMTWSPERFLRAFAPDEPETTQADWFDRVRILAATRGDVAGRRSPSEWALFIDDRLVQLNWPGSAALTSIDFQLLNRWRELLNDLARLELVTASISFAEALARIQAFANDAIFQPESEGAVVQLLGPLEAAGMEFDQLWVTGLTATHWPPAGRPSPLVSRQLQREFGMPDADPGDTLDYATAILKRLRASTFALYCSYPHTEGDAEQSPTGLMRVIAEPAEPKISDPGCFAASQVNSLTLEPAATDDVPAIAHGEKVTGGAGTLQRQMSDPFSAFAYGRLGIRPVMPILNGVPANIRGSLIHNALHELYRDTPTRSEIATWPDLDERLPGIIGRAFFGLERRADDTLRQLLKLERHRVADLLRSVVALDSDRDDFAIAGVETTQAFVAGELELRLRVDRIDRLGNDELLILDYKTGQRRQFVNSAMEADDIQLIVYACAVAEPIAGLAFVNVDSRNVDLNGAGRELTPQLDWESTLAGWRAEVLAAAETFALGDVRLNGALPIKASRSFGLLSRIRELQHGD